MEQVEPAGLRAALQRLGQLMLARDLAIMDEFAENGVLVGSEPGEIARGRAELEPFFAAIFALPAAYTWEWDGIDLSARDSIGWLFAEGHAVARSQTGTVRRPYRLSGVLQRDGGHWRWRLFHGSEPKV